MSRGPLPNPKARRRNAPTISTTALPAEGRKEPAPAPPYELRGAGQAWWVWAWALPQAAAWDAGALYALARRAQLEDDLVALEAAESVDWGELFGIEEERDAIKRLESLLRKLKALAGGRVSVMREMRELDNRFGLNAKAMADLRWSIATPDEEKSQDSPEVRRLRAV